MRNEMDLTAKEIKEVDEITLDKQSAEKTLQIALQFHSNQMNKLYKKEKIFWEHLSQSRDLEKSKNWMVDRSGASVFIRESIKDE